MLKDYPLVKKKVSELLPYVNNSREHSLEQIQQIKTSITEFGFTNPVLIGDNDIVIAGHARLQAAKELNIDEIPCIILSGLDDNQKRAYVIADNKLALNSTWNIDMLRHEMSNLFHDGFDVGTLGFSDIEIGELLEPQIITPLSADDDLPDMQEVTVTKTGDVWVLGDHRLICGSCLDLSILEKLMQSDKADLYLTDPPYGCDLEGRQNDRHRSGFRKKKIDRKSNIENDNLKTKDLQEFLYKAFHNATMFLKSISAYYIFSPQWSELMHQFSSAIARTDFNLKHILIWVKDNHVLGRGDYHYKHEPFFHGYSDEFEQVLYGWLETGKHQFYGGRKHKSVWEFSKPLKSDLHPTMKPVDLFARCIQNSSMIGHIVLDGFAGSGTTLIASEKLQRKARLVELDPAYCDLIVKRWEEYTGKQAVLEK